MANIELVTLALSSALGVPLSHADGVIRLLDQQQNERLVLEQLPDKDQVVAYALIGPMIEGEGASQASQYLLRWNAEVDTLGDCRIIADLDRAVYCLIKPLRIESFRQVVETCQTLLNQSEDIQALLQEKFRQFPLSRQPAVGVA